MSTKDTDYPHQCKLCLNIKAKKQHNTEKNRAARKRQYNKRRQSGKQQLSTRRALLKREYGITLEQYDKLFKAQNGVCIICGGVNNDGRKLFVDHDHNTGKIRGLLCYQCNLMLGNARDNLSILKSAVNYLKLPRLGKQE